MPMSHFLYTDSDVKRQRKEWTESEKQKFNFAVRIVGNQPIRKLIKHYKTGKCRNMDFMN